jgi:type IV secretory pathway VirD2 relaxase
MHFARMSAKTAGAVHAGGSLPGGRAFTQRCAIRVTYSKSSDRGQWRAHGRYIARESAAASSLAGFDKTEENRDPAAVCGQWQAAGDGRLFKLIISPEFGDRIDLQSLTRRLLFEMEADLGTSLEWVAAAHFNTGHPHVHVALRGIRDNGEPLLLDRPYVKSGIRSRAENICTAQLGYRSEVDAAEAERREISESRYTSLDRLLRRRAQSDPEHADKLVVTCDPTAGRLGPMARIQEQHLAARLQVLQAMHLATPAARNVWLVSADYETILRAMQNTADRQRMLASHAALLSDPRLPMQVTDHRSIRWLEGRVISHGEDEATGRTYMLLEGTDGKVHFVPHSREMTEAWAAGRLQPNEFARLRRAGADRRLEVTGLGDAEKLLEDRRYFLSTAARLVRRGVLPELSTTSGWLGCYHQQLARVSQQIGHRGEASKTVNTPHRTSQER